ncbi:hypothetical protein K2P56_01550 [Patescibacteria group bacterium]|nr:hypothetical protein [Patescibacteria group bacterium]
MARVKVSEYRAKRLLLGDSYTGVSVTKDTQFSVPQKGRYVVKVDQGIKKRFKQKLVVINIPASEIRKHIRAWSKKGFTRFLVEEYVEHSPQSEQYLSFDRIRTGVRVLFSTKGGIDIEESSASVQSFDIRGSEDSAYVSKKTLIPEQFVRTILSAFDAYHLAFLEINPLVVIGSKVWALDAALLVDDAGEQLVHGAWSEADYTESKKKHRREATVAELDKTTPASLKLTILNPHGSLFFLLSGGGGSITIGDHAVSKKAGSLIANYGEYSGGPTREETYLYAREIIGLMLSSKSKKRALVIAGGIANFTDVSTTFSGIIDALTERASDLAKANVKVFVRRGGPREAEGLLQMKQFLKHHRILGSISGSAARITDAVEKAIAYVTV